MQLKSHSVEPLQADSYTILAEFYDFVMEHVDYRAWTDYILLLCHTHNHIPEKILELACGTGSLMQELGNSGLSPIGMDRSAPMLKAAKHKMSGTRESSKKCNLIRSNITAPSVRNMFDTILCMYDSINYLPTLNDVIDTVHTVFSLLVPGGVFIFDMCTEYNSLRHFNASSSSGYFNQYSYTRYSHYDTTEKMQTTDFIITARDTGTTWKERHVQYIYPITDIRNALERNFPGQVRMFKDFTLDPPEERCERVHMYLTKN